MAFLLAPLLIAQRRARKLGKFESYLLPVHQRGMGQFLVDLFWEMDLVGSLLVSFRC